MNSHREAGQCRDRGHAGPCPGANFLVLSCVEQRLGESCVLRVFLSARSRSVMMLLRAAREIADAIVFEQIADAIEKPGEGRAVANPVAPPVESDALDDEGGLENALRIAALAFFSSQAPRPRVPAS